MNLRTFIDTFCVKHPAAKIQLVELLRLFNEKQEGEPWRRGRLVTELVRAGFQIGMSDGRYHVAGLSLAGRWQSVDGQLEFRPGRTKTVQTYTEVLCAPTKEDLK